MPNSISGSQKSISGFDIGGEDRGKFKLLETKTEFEKYGDKFKRIIASIGNRKGVVATGHLIVDGAQFKIVDDGKTMQIIMPDYFDYPNEGVKGVKSSRNAPTSPYQFKNYGMNAEGRANIKKYIEQGHAKISTVRKSNDKALGIGLERKHVSLIDMQTESLIFLIKKYGIKKTSYFTEALNETFKDFEVKMSAALGRDIVFLIEKKNR
jgi:hypothetical protein